MTRYFTGTRNKIMLTNNIIKRYIRAQHKLWIHCKRCCCCSKAFATCFPSSFYVRRFLYTCYSLYNDMLYDDVRCFSFWYFFPHRQSLSNCDVCFWQTSTTSHGIYVMLLLNVCVFFVSSFSALLANKRNGCSALFDTILVRLFRWITAVNSHKQRHCNIWLSMVWLKKRILTFRNNERTK